MVGGTITAGAGGSGEFLKVTGALSRHSPSSQRETWGSGGEEGGASRCQVVADTWVAGADARTRAAHLLAVPGPRPCPHECPGGQQRAGGWQSEPRAPGMAMAELLRSLQDSELIARFQRRCGLFPAPDEGPGAEKSPADHGQDSTGRAASLQVMGGQVWARARLRGGLEVGGIWGRAPRSKVGCGLGRLRHTG